jgi:hypothetical protein
MTGGRRGLCGRTKGAADSIVTGGYGRKMGMRRGFGRGCGRGSGLAYGGSPYPSAYQYPLSKTDELEMLRADADARRKSLEAIQRRVEELEKEGSE